jgi:hypothetical protein
LPLSWEGVENRRLKREYLMETKITLDRRNDFKVGET